MSKTFYLLSMTGTEDQDYRLVDEETWEWINSNLPDFPEGVYGMNDPSVPDIVKQNLFTACYGERGARFPDDPKTWQEVTVHVSTGSGDNDRMLASYGFLNGENLQFFSVTDLNKFVKENDIEIVDEMEGAIY
jgi:hypothetical protein